MNIKREPRTDNLTRVCIKERRRKNHDFTSRWLCCDVTKMMIRDTVPYCIHPSTIPITARERDLVEEK